MRHIGLGVFEPWDVEVKVKQNQTRSSVTAALTLYPKPYYHTGKTLQDNTRCHNIQFIH